MINNDNETVTTKSNPITSIENNSIMSATVDLSNPTGEEQPVQNQNNDLNEAESQDNQIVEVENDDDEFIRITAAHQMLTEGKHNHIFLLETNSLFPLFSAQTYDEQKNFPAALHLYRICVDLLLEELMFTEGTEQSRVYLREKCTAVMDRIDLLKTMLDPLPPPSTTPPAIETTTTPATTTNPPTEELNSLHLS
jgi:hypothetical protein